MTCPTALETVWEQQRWPVAGASRGQTRRRSSPLSFREPPGLLVQQAAEPRFGIPTRFLDRGVAGDDSVVDRDVPHRHAGGLAELIDRRGLGRAVEARVLRPSGEGIAGVA